MSTDSQVQDEACVLELTSEIELEKWKKVKKENVGSMGMDSKIEICSEMKIFEKQQKHPENEQVI